MYRILLTSCGSQASINVIQALKDKPVEIVGMDYNKTCASRDMVDIFISKYISYIDLYKEQNCVGIIPGHSCEVGIIEDIKGYIGNYEISIKDSKNNPSEIKTGAIIVATGGQELKPEGLFEYDGKNTQVMTQLEVEQKLQEADKSWLEKLKRVTFILCAGARQKEGITYCSNVCCGTSIKNINILKELNPNLEIVVVYRDFQMAKKEFEEYYRDRRKDAMFLRYDLDHIPKITKVGKSPEKYKVEVFDTNLQDNLDFETDLIVLATPMIPADNLKDLAMMLKVPLDRTGFFLEAHVKLRPLDFATDGIFLCGVAQWPKNIQDSIERSSWIRKMFEEGHARKAKFGEENVFVYGNDESRSALVDLSVSSPAKLGAEKGADLVLYVRIERYKLYEMDRRGYYSALMHTQSVLLDAKNDRIVWPRDRQAKLTRIKVDLETSGREKTLKLLADATSHCITRFLYNCSVDRFKSGYEQTEYNLNEW